MMRRLALLIAILSGVSTTAYSAEKDTHEKVASIFARQHIAFDEMLDRVKKRKVTKEDAEFLGSKNPANTPGIAKTTARIQGHQSDLEGGQWAGPLQRIYSNDIGVDQVGEMKFEIRVSNVLSDDSYVGQSRNNSDPKAYLLKGWKTDNLATGVDVLPNGAVIVSGTQQVGALRCLVIEPINKYAPKKEDLLKAKAKLLEDAAKAKK